MRPVDNRFPRSQGFAEGATQGVDPNGSHPMAPYVRQYGNYQPYGHAGEDIACPVGTPVYAMAPGKVIWADWGTSLPGDETDRGYRQRFYLYKGFPGIVTIIQHPWGKGVYAHLSSNDAAPAGTVVKEGQLIGYSGDTGGVAPHLHVEALVDDGYNTVGGLIYGRTNPAQFYGTGGSALAPQSTIIKEDTLSAAEVKQINDHATKEADRVIDYVGKVLVAGYNIGDTKLPGGNAVNIVTQQRVSAVLALVTKSLERPDLTAADITAAVEKGLENGAITVDINVAGGK